MRGIEANEHSTGQAYQTLYTLMPVSGMFFFIGICGSQVTITTCLFMGKGDASCCWCTKCLQAQA